MIALAFLLGASVVALAATTVTFAVLSRRDSAHLASVRVAQAHSETEQTLLVFECEQLRQAHRAANARAAALEEVIADVQKADPGAGLRSDDWHSRYLRLSKEFGIAAAESGVPAVGDGDDVPASAAPGSPNAHPVPSGSATVR